MEQSVGGFGGDASLESPQNMRETTMSRALGNLEEGDAIGILSVVAQALEQLDIAEATEDARNRASHGMDGFESSEGPSFQGPYTDFDSESVDRGHGKSLGARLVTSKDIEEALSHDRHIGGETIHDAYERGESPHFENCGTPDAGPRKKLSKMEMQNRNDRDFSNPGFRKRKNSRDSKKIKSSPAMFGTEAHVPFSKGISNYFATVGSTREKRVVALSAWGVTIVGLLVCLVLVTRDFLQSKREAMVALSYELEDYIDLPSTYICSTQVSFPAFASLPDSSYLGEPFIWVHSLKMPGNDSSKVSYPATQSHSNIEFITLDIFGNRCNASALTSADAAGFWNSRLSEPDCFNCVHVKSEPPIRILRSDAESRGGSHFRNSAVGASFHVEVSQSLLVTACRNTHIGLQRSVFVATRNLVVDNIEALRKRGTLSFGTANPQTEEQYLEFFPLGRLRHEFGYDDLIVGDVADVLCNTALFSGFFYPAPESQDIAFVFDNKSLRWGRKQGSKGPYYPPDFEYWFNVPEMKDGVPIPGQMVGPKIVEPQEGAALDLEYKTSRQIAEGNWIKVFVKNSLGGTAPMKQISAFRLHGIDTVYFTKHSNNGNVTYSTVNEPFMTFTVDGVNINHNFAIRLTCDDFLHRKVSNQVTVQVTSFLADFFGLIELFLDLSVYTLIVSPLVVSTRRRALVARARDAQAAPVSPV